MRPDPMRPHPIFGRYEDGPTVCVAHPKVMKNIHKELRAARAISAQEGRLASMMGLAPAGVTNVIGFNDGIIYPPDEGPVAAPARGRSLAPSLALAPQPVRKLHALALLVDFSDNKGSRPAADFHRMLFDAGNPNSMTSYYKTISNGALQVSGEVKGYVRAPKPYTFYTNGQSGTVTQSFTVAVTPVDEGSALVTKRYIAVGAAAGAMPRVTVFDISGAPVASFFAFAPNFRGGVRVAVGDVNGDGTSDIIVAAGPGGSHLVKVIDGTRLGQLADNAQVGNGALLGSFFAFQPTYVGGVSVAAGDVNGDGLTDIIVGKGPHFEPRVKVVDGTKHQLRTPGGQIANAVLLGNFLAYQPTFIGGVMVAAGDVNGDGLAEILVASNHLAGLDVLRNVAVLDRALGLTAGSVAGG